MAAKPDSLVGGETRRHETGLSATAGGNYLEGDTIPDRFAWKNYDSWTGSAGRPSGTSRRYRSSDGMGLLGSWSGAKT